MKKEIWEIHTFGTSFTKGGGFEFWSNPKLKEFYKDIAEPKLQFNFSWPGQLQKILQEEKNYKTQIINHAKSGYGHELTIRAAFDIIQSNIDSLDSKIFVFEFGALGRKEYWDNEIGWIITNYHFKTKNSEFTHVVGEDEEHETVTHGMAQTYFEDSDRIKNSLKEHEELFSKFNKLTINFNTELEKTAREIINFLSFCNQLDVNYILSSAPFIPYHYTNLSSVWEGKEMIYELNGKQDLDLYGFLENHKLRIKDETNGFIDDGHGGYEGNKIVANQIYNRIKNLQDVIFPVHVREN